jgi:hypothetical protein
VLAKNDVPRPGAQIVFVSAAKSGRQEVTTDANGKFRVTLASGDWLVYVAGADQRPAFHSRINVSDNEIRQVVLVSQ